MTSSCSHLLLYYHWWPNGKYHYWKKIALDSRVSKSLQSVIQRFHEGHVTSVTIAVCQRAFCVVGSSENVSSEILYEFEYKDAPFPTSGKTRGAWSNPKRFVGGINRNEPPPPAPTLVPALHRTTHNSSNRSTKNAWFRPHWQFCSWHNTKQSVWFTKSVSQ